MNTDPISILPTILKILKSHIASQLQICFENTRILSQSQSMDNRYEGKYVGPVFLDIRKDFDLVDHQILLHKLNLYHFTDKAHL